MYPQHVFMKKIRKISKKYPQIFPVSFPLTNLYMFVPRQVKFLTCPKSNGTSRTSVALS